ncbi:hypothetical protein D9M68_597020 [compost metagenome]
MAQQVHHDDGANKGNGAEQADIEGARDAGRLDQRRHPERQAVLAGDEGEVNQAHPPDALVGEHGAQRMLLRARLLLVQLDFAGQQLLFIVAQPLRTGDAVVQVHDGRHADEQRRDGFDQEHPLPALQAVRAVKGLHDPPGQRVAENAGHRNGGHEQRDDLGAAMGRIPVCQVQDHAGIETRFGQAQQEAQDVEAGRRLDEHEHARQDPPRNHDARDPDAGAQPVHEQVARHFEKEIANEEHTGAQAEHGFAEPQVLRHLQFGEAHVDAIEVGDHVAEHQERHQPPEHLGVGARGFAGFRRCRGGLRAERRFHRGHASLQEDAPARSAGTRPGGFVGKNQ